MGPATVRDNTISAATIAISADASNGRVADNDISDSVIGISWSGEGGVVANNTVHGGTTGIIVGAGTVTVKGNSVEGAENTGMLVYATATTELSGNTLGDHTTDLDIVEGAAVSDDGTNEVCGETPAA
jgi:parallel beta-helix repeat protein